MERNLAMDAVRVTEAAALASARFMGLGDHVAADRAAAEAMRQAFDSIAIDGTIVIGEGPEDAIHVLYVGERVGAGGRAADVALKEKRPLILVPRETPFSAIHLENMLRLAHAGAVILPPNPGFYHHPQSVEALIDFVVARILDHLGVPHALMQRWGAPAR